MNLWWFNWYRLVGKCVSYSLIPNLLQKIPNLTDFEFEDDFTRKKVPFCFVFFRCDLSRLSVSQVWSHIWMQFFESYGTSLTDIYQEVSHRDIQWIFFSGQLCKRYKQKIQKKSAGIFFRNHSIPGSKPRQNKVFFSVCESSHYYY